MRFILLFLILRDQIPVSETELTVKQMFEEANGYIKVKGTEYDAKKVAFSERLFKQAQLEQRQLAAKYAALAAQSKDLAGDDLYYLGMLHWIAENLDGTVENLRKFIAFEGVAPDRRQTARSIVVVVLAKQKKLSAVEAGRTRQNGGRTCQGLSITERFCPHGPAR
jgi:hypothetical protein